MPRSILAMVLCGFTVLAQTSPPVAEVRSMTVAEMETFVKASIQLKMPDQQLADYVRERIKLVNKLDGGAVKTLQEMGAGPATLAALRDLSDTSASLPPSPPPAPKPVAAAIPAPDSVEQKKILAEIAEKARNYMQSLPNLTCLRVTRRYEDSAGKGNYRLIDTLAEQLSFFDHKENYKVVSVNGLSVTNIKQDQLRSGMTSSGEFGSMLANMFDPEAETEFNWERWATLRGRRMYVYNYRVLQSRSKYSIYHQKSGRMISAGHHGLVYADSDNGMVMRIKMDCDLPRDSPIQSVSLDLNYDFVKISEQVFILPFRAEVLSREGRLQVKNEIDFALFKIGL